MLIEIICKEDRAHSAAFAFTDKIIEVGAEIRVREFILVLNKFINILVADCDNLNFLVLFEKVDIRIASPGTENADFKHIYASVLFLRNGSVHCAAFSTSS